MGLLYVFPVSLEETDFAEKKHNDLVLKTYGLPYIFWIYAFCSVAVVFFMFLAIKAPVLKLVELGDDVDATLGYSLLTFIGLVPVMIFSFFFFEKRIIKGHGFLTLEYRLYGLNVFSKKYQLEPQDFLSIDSYLSSPNVARMKNHEEGLGFQNKGYFVLWLKTKEGKRVQLDRHSRKADLEKLKNLLEEV